MPAKLSWNIVRPALGAALISCSGLVCQSAAAESSEELLKLIEVLRQNGSISVEQYERLRDEAMASQQEAAEAATEEPPEDEVKVTTKGGIGVESSDGAFSFRFNGRIHADGAIYDDDDIELGDGTEIRRARFAASGKILHDWQYKLQYDFTDSGSDGIRDAYIRYNGFGPVQITLGHYKEYFSLEELTSSNDITFMERALPNAFAPGRRMGIGAKGHGDTWSVAGGLFSEGADSNEDDEVDEGYAVNARGTFAPLLSDRQLVHLGVAGEYRVTDRNDELRFRARPESHVTNERLVNTGTIEDVDNFYTLGAEVATVWGSFSAQGEYIYTELDRDSGNDPDFDGWYLFGSYILTGESRPYDVKSGVFKRVKPDSKVGAGGIGAWEVGLRYSQISLNDREIKGGREDNITLGLNWYANDNIRFMFNYIRADLDRSGSDDDDVNIYQARAQVTF